MDSTNDFEIPGMSNVTFSVDGIQHQLSKLDANKAKSLDNISPYILKHCANEISPVLQVIFTQSLNTGTLPSDWLQANICPVLKKVIALVLLSAYITSTYSKIMEHILYHSSCHT